MRYVFTFLLKGKFLVRTTQAPSYAWALAFVQSADLLDAKLVTCVGPY